MKLFRPNVACPFGSVALRYRHPLLGVVGRRSAYPDISGNRTGISAGKTSEGCSVEPPERQVLQLETLLFLSRQPQTSRKLAQLAGLADGTKARTLVRSLNRRYDAVGCAFRVEEVAGGFQLMTRAKFAPWLRRLHSAPAEVRLSASAMETLAVVAYRQPVLRAEIEAIRGVQSGEVLRQLIERNLVRIAGRSEELGRPFLYRTTRQFLQIFGLRHLDELPKAEVFRTRGPASANISTDPNLNSDTPKHPNQSQRAEEENDVKTLITPWQCPLEENSGTVVLEPRRDNQSGRVEIFAKRGDEEEDEDLDEDDEDDDFDDDEFEEEEEEEDEEDLDEEPWEEVEDEDSEEEEEEDEDWDDEDWDDEDWDDEDEEDEEEDDDDWDDEDEEEQEDDEE